jgi:hypothetical protein
LVLVDDQSFWKWNAKIGNDWNYFQSGSILEEVNGDDEEVLLGPETEDVQGKQRGDLLIVGSKR